MNTNRKTYKLTGIIVHRSLYSTCGHYTTFLRSSLSDTQWLYMDDAEVCKIIFQSDSFLAFHISFSIEFNVDLMDKDDVG